MLKQKRRSAPQLPKRDSAGIVAPSAMLDLAGTESADSPRRRCPASRVYETMELRAQIFDLIDRNTLAGMMRLEKSAIASVASVLYRHIHVSVVSQISRSSPRRSIYCQSVRTIDRSPIPMAPIPILSPTPDPIAFDPEALIVLLEYVAGLRLAFPLLQSLQYEHPAYAGDDSYVVHLGSEDITVDVINVVQLEISKHSSPPDLVDTLPLIPSLVDGVRVRHMIRLSIDITSGSGVSKATLGVWKDWIYHNPELDRRIIALNITPRCRRKLGVTPDDTKSLIALRASARCEPLQHIAVQLAYPLPAGGLGTCFSLLPRDLQALRIECIGSTPNWEDLVQAIGERFPLLQNLELNDYRRDVVSTHIPPLSGLPHLRYFRHSSREPLVTQQEPTVTLDNPFRLARNLYRLGSRDCAFCITDYNYECLYSELQSLISKLKSNRPEYAYLHTVGIDDLDVWKNIAVVVANSLFNGEPLKRYGWDQTVSISTKLVNKGARFDAELNLQQSHIVKYKDTFAKAIRDLAGTEGDLLAQGEVIKRHFEVAEEQKGTLQDGFKAMRAAIIEMEKATERAGDYTKTWLEHQAPKPKSG